MRLIDSLPSPPDLRGRDFLALHQYESAEILYLLEQALEIKQKQKAGIPHPYLSGQVLGMIFDKNSTRTRVSFEVGMYQLGGQAIFLSSRDLQLGRGETIHDTAKVLSRYVDGIMIRASSHQGMEELAEHASIPVINGLSDDHHPVQIMADLLTILEHKGKLSGLKMSYVGDGNNVCHSLIEGAAKVGMQIWVATPSGYEPNQEIVKQAREFGEQMGSEVIVTNDPIAAVREADVVVTDVWASMGMEEEQDERSQRFAAYQVNAQLCAHAKSDYIFLHCLPAHRGEEVTEEIIDGPHSVVFDEAENRLHAQKAILTELMKK